MSDAVTFQLGNSTGRSRKRRRAPTGASENGTGGNSSAVAGAFAHNVTAGEAVDDSKDEREDDGDLPVIVESVDVVGEDTLSPKKSRRSPLDGPDAEDGGGGERVKDGAPVSQIARLIERRRRKVSAGALDEDAAYKMDVAECPDEATSDAYSRVPVESFGASLLKRMGWDGKPDARSEALASGPVSRLRGGEPEGAAAPGVRRKRQRMPPKTNSVDTGTEAERASATEKRDSEGGTFARDSPEGSAQPSGEKREDLRGVRRNEVRGRARGDDARRSNHAYAGKKLWETDGEGYGGDARSDLDNGVRVRHGHHRGGGEGYGGDARSDFDTGVRARHGHHRGEVNGSSRRRDDRDGDRSRRSSGYASRWDDRHGSDRSQGHAAYRERDDRDRRRDDDERFASRNVDRDSRRRR